LEFNGKKHQNSQKIKDIQMVNWQIISKEAKIKQKPTNKIKKE
jgi:hypothetical protein